VRLTEGRAKPAQLAPVSTKGGRGRITEEKVKARLAPLDKPHDRGRPNLGINSAVRELGIDRTEAQRANKIAKAFALPSISIGASCAETLRTGTHQRCILRLRGLAKFVHVHPCPKSNVCGQPSQTRP
jgi:hypothetical protein